MAKTFKSIKEILREQRIYNTLNETKTSVFDNISDMLEIQENLKKDLELDLATVDYGY